VFIKILKFMGLAILGIVLLLVIIGVLFVNFSPQFGKSPTDEQLVEYALADNHRNGIFVNQTTTTLDFPGFGIMWEFIKGSPKRRPSKNIEVLPIDSLGIVQHDQESAQLTWFGHSAFLLQLDGKTILLDPMFGSTPAPHPMLGNKRYSKELPIAIEKLPHIDAIIISHDHYDHLDYGSILKLKDKVDRFYVPLGVGNHLIEWGVPASQIEELNWWDSTTLDHINLVSAPARHFSGRGLSDRSTTLWCSWIIQGANEHIYFSGDGGYGPHFKEIGEKYGPFDISLMECGQYNEKWASIHMMPEETAQAAVDLNSKVMMPIHWGAFTLALHDWTDPADRVTKAAANLGMPVTTPRIGQPIILGASYPDLRWWELIDN
jgi:L-ascorbate metabolism protein UlaG (beta-lactamase superfamily)